MCAWVGVCVVSSYDIIFPPSPSSLSPSPPSSNPPPSNPLSPSQLSARLLTLQQQTRLPPTTSVTMDITATEGDKSNEQLWEIIR